MLLNVVCLPTRSARKTAVCLLSSNSNDAGAQDVHARDDVVKGLGCDVSLEAGRGEETAGRTTHFKVSL